MAYDTYATLKTTIADVLARDDLTTALDLFITQSTGLINRRLRIREMEDIATLTPVSGVCTLPTDYLQYRRVVDTGSPMTELAYMAPSALDQAYAAGWTGKAAHFTIIGSSLYTMPLTAYDVELTYYAKAAALTDVVTTNTVLAAYPDIYLRASLAFGSDYIKDNGEAQKHMGLAESLMAEIMEADRMANYAKAGMWVKGVTP